MVGWDVILEAGGWLEGHLNRFCPWAGPWVRIGLGATTISQTTSTALFTPIY